MQPLLSISSGYTRVTQPSVLTIFLRFTFTSKWEPHCQYLLVTMGWSLIWQSCLLSFLMDKSTPRCIHYYLWQYSQSSLFTRVMFLENLWETKLADTKSMGLWEIWCKLQMFTIPSMDIMNLNLYCTYCHYHTIWRLALMQRCCWQC